MTKRNNLSMIRKQN